MSSNQPPPDPYGPQPGQPGEDQPQRPQQPDLLVGGHGQPPAPAAGGGIGRRRAGLIAGTAVALAAVGVGIFVVSRGNGDNGDGGLRNDGKKRTIDSTLDFMDGYRLLTDDNQDKVNKVRKADYQAMGLDDPHTVSDVFEDDGGLVTKRVVFQGFWGTVKHPAKAIDATFPVVARELSGPTTKAVPVGTPKEFKPKYLDSAIMQCQSMKVTGPDPRSDSVSDEPTSVTVTLPVCIWADFSTIGVVVAYDADSLPTGKPSMTLAQTADLTRNFHDGTTETM